MPRKKICFTVPSEFDGVKALTFLKKNCSVSTRIISSLKREKEGILRNGEILRTIDILRAGDRVELNLSEDKNKIAPVRGDLNILFEDEYLIVIDKSFGVPVHPTKVHQLNTLANFLSFRQNERDESYTFRAVNRLDKDTSGIVIVAKDKYCAFSLSDTVDKTYYAVCEGMIQSSGTIDKPIRLLEGHTVQRTTSPDGEPSVTHYFPLSHTHAHTFLKVKLETGRTHQIRCHFSSIGHPLAGDDMYGGSLDCIDRQALHCGEASFPHPITGEKMLVKSPLPEDMKKLI